MVDSHCRSDQLNQARSSDQGLVELAWQEWSGSSTLLASPRLPTRKFWTYVKKIRAEIKNSSAQEAIKSDQVLVE